MASTRLLKENDQKIYWTFADGSEPTGAADVSVLLTRSDGTVLPDPVITNEQPVGLFSAVLEHDTHTDVLDDITVTWEGIVSGLTQKHSYISNVIGKHYFELLELRQQSGVRTVSKYNDASLAVARQRAEATVENVCEAAFVPRLGTDIFDSRDYLHGPVDYYYSGPQFASGGIDRSSGLFLRNEAITGLRSVTLDGVDLDISEWSVTRNGQVRTSGLTDDFSNEGELVIRYEYGAAQPEGDLIRATLRLARHILLEENSAIADRARLMQTEFGLFVMDTAGKDKPTGIPEVDSVLVRYMQTSPVSFA